MMVDKFVIVNANVVNNGKTEPKDVFINAGKIEKIENCGSNSATANVIDANGQFLLPGVIDDQVHFREPGFTHKANIYSESRAALAGGTTTFMEMPNTNPQTTTIEKLEEKMQIAAQSSATNYSFFLGGTNHNLEELLKIDLTNTCGIKLFMGSSTGDMLVDNPSILESIFSKSDALIATHCEYEPRVKERNEKFIAEFGDLLSAKYHPIIRDEQCCFLSSSFAVDLAKKHNTRLHILHITTEDETNLFTNEIPLTQKRITSEVCVHHLHFTANDYEKLGNQIKCNPAIKDAHHKPKLWEALKNNKLDIVATDHAPHTWDEKMQHYIQAPSGLPLVQHSLLLMLDYVKKGEINIEFLVEKMCHAPAQCFKIKERGFLQEGFWADMVLINNNKYTVNNENILYKCAWSPFNNATFTHTIDKVWVNGQLGFANGGLTNHYKPMRIEFGR